MSIWKGKRIIFFSVLRSIFTVGLFLSSIVGNAQSKKPTIMVLPSDNWCDQRFFMTSFEDQGNKISVPDYQTAFREDSEIGAVVSQIGELLTELGYSLKDSEQEIKRLSIVQAEDNVTQSKNGSILGESPLDILKRRTKSDIIIQIGWQVNKESKGKSVSFIIEAFDTYTSKRVATATGISKSSNDIVPRILASSVKQHIKKFDDQMTQYFNSLQNNGREIVLTIRRWNNWENDLDTEIEGEELIDIIQKWLTKNTINGNYNLTDYTENVAQFEQVKIPLYNKNGIAIDARSYATELRKYLSQNPYNIPSKVMTRGLGEAIIVLGEK